MFHASDREKSETDTMGKERKGMLERRRRERKEMQEKRRGNVERKREKHQFRERER